MSIVAYQVNNGMPTPIADRHMYGLLSGGQCGVISGMTLTKNGNQITVADGWGIINGCIFRVKSEVLTAPLSPSGSTVNGRLIVRLNTTTPSIEFDFQTAASLPSLVQESGDNFTYEMELCRYQVSGVTITSDLDTSNQPSASSIDMSEIDSIIDTKISNIRGYVKTGTTSNKTLSMSLSGTTLTITYS